MDKNRIIITLLCVLLGSICAFAQTMVKGKVTDKATGEDMIGVGVSSSAGGGTTTEVDGTYELSLPDGTHTLTFTYLGYADVTRDLTISGEPSITMDVTMEEESEVLVITTVVSGRHEKDLTKEAVSVDVIRPEFIERNANTDLAQVVERVPGVQVVDGQANIRSGSGFAYGAGSRVAVVVDEQPLLSAELSDVKWNFIPIENASQIEIIKGAASVLYGSGGLNGVINVRSAYPTSEPYTKLTVYSGMYHIGKNNNREGFDRQWYTWGKPDSLSTKVRDQPFFSGIYFAHRQKIKENFDLVLGSNIHYDRNFMKTADEQRYRFNFNTRYRPPQNDGITFGLNGNIMFHKKADFFLWKDGYENAFVHIDDPISPFGYYTVTLDPHITAFDNYKNKHTGKLRYFTINKLIGNDGSPTAVYSGEYQFQREMDDKDMVVTAGTSYQRFFARSNLFADEVVMTETDTFTRYSAETADVMAFYAQMDKGFFDSKLNITLGVRAENFRVSGGEGRTIPVFRGGASYSVSKKDFLRASFGQGYRVPSLAEKYISDDITDGINVYPTPDLKVETGHSTEIGYKRAFGKKDGFQGFADVALFWMDYDNMTEFRFGLYRPEGVEGDTTLNDLFQYLGFKAQNVSRARIAGFELSAFGEGNVGALPMRFWAGYTYSFPGDLTDDPSQQKVGKFISNMARGFILKPGDPLTSSLLNFRAMHIGRLDVEVDVKEFTFGAAANYSGFMYDIDDFFKGEGELVELVMIFRDDVRNIIESLDLFRDSHARGDWIVDLRASYRFKEDNKVDIILNNAFNREYAIRPLKMSPPLTLNMRYSRSF